MPDLRRGYPSIPDLSPPIRAIIAGIVKGQTTLTKKSVAANLTIPAGYAAYVPDELEIATGIEVEIGDGATLEIG